MPHEAPSTSTTSVEAVAWFDRGMSDRSPATLLERLRALAAHDDLPVAARRGLDDAIGALLGRGAGASAAARERALLDALPDAVVVHDERGGFVEANAAACRLFGYAREKLLALGLTDVFPSLPPDHLRHVVDAWRAGSAFTLETTIRRGDGRSFPVEMHANVRVEDGVTRVLAVARGIGHWQRIAEELRDLERRYRALSQATDIGVAILDAQGETVFCNAALCRMLGMTESQYRCAEREGFPGRSYFGEDGQPLAAADLPAMRALRTGLPVESMVFGIQPAQGDRALWVASNAVPLFRPGCDAPYEVICTCSDITALKSARDLLARTQASAKIGGYELALDTRRLVWTEEMYRLFDLPADVPLTLERALALLAPHSRERALIDIDEAAKGYVTTCEYEIRTALGRRRWLSVVSRPLRHGDTVYAVTGMCQDVTERKLVELELRRKAVTDAVTGLPNRESTLEELNRQIIATRDGGGPALLYVDLDRFKVINDVLGASAGDRLLALAAARLRESVPDGALCGRFGGDEFLVVLPQAVHKDRLGEIAETINAKFRRPFEHDGEEFVITASVGVARYPDGGGSAAQLLQHADAAMSEAKHRGRSTWQTFSPAIARRLENNFAVESQLRHALANREFRLAYQPQVELASGRVVAAEALLRWQHPQRGELHPLAFVQNAENSGDIVAIGAWVIDETCRQMREWRDAGLRLERVAVNVSYRQLLSESFLDFVVEALRRYDLPGNALELEIIERMLIEDTPDTMQLFKELRAIGVSITIDDFGEGYSALNYLRRLPVDGLKISYDFMRRVPGNETDAAICEAIIRVGHGLGLAMVAEGVETNEQRMFLLRHGMRLGQGHLFSPALDASRLAAFARARAFSL